MNKRKYAGVVVPMATPVKAGSVDMEAVEKIIRSFAEAGVDVLVMGTAFFRADDRGSVVQKVQELK